MRFIIWVIPLERPQEKEWYISKFCRVYPWKETLYANLTFLANFVSFKGVFNCVAYFMDLKCENFTFSFFTRKHQFDFFIPVMHRCANFHSILQLRTILMLSLWTNGNIIINKITFLIACKGHSVGRLSFFCLIVLQGVP